MRFCVVNLGCKVNRVESDAAARQLMQAGWAPCEEALADIVVVNTCTVTAEADKKTRKAIRHVVECNPDARVVVTGCASAIDPDFYASLGAHVVVVPKPELSRELDVCIRSAGERAGYQAGESFDCAEGRAPHASSCFADGRMRRGVKVQDGCDNACTYCIVHVARGAARSMDAAEIVAESVGLAQAGVNEIMLTGINLGTYRSSADLGQKPGAEATLADLLRRLLDATAPLRSADEPAARFRIGSIEPMDVDEDLANVLAEANGRICRHLHLPLQSGSSKVLAEMERPYDAEEFLRIVGMLRSRVPELALSTDVIVGFPGETDDDFRQTVAVCEKAGFMRLHVFPYSKRAGTPAAQRPDQVPAEVKRERARKLRELSVALAERDRLSRAGTMELALVEEPGRATSESYHEVAVSPCAEIGSLVPFSF